MFQKSMQKKTEMQKKGCKKNAKKAIKGIRGVFKKNLQKKKGKKVKTGNDAFR